MNKTINTNQFLVSLSRHVLRHRRGSLLPSSTSLRSGCEETFTRGIRRGDTRRKGEVTKGISYHESHEFIVLNIAFIIYHNQSVIGR